MSRPGKADLALLKDPDELLDKYMLLRDENTVLKKHNNQQEDKIKKLATKLVRITADLKKRMDDDGGVKKGERIRDFRAEERIQELQQELQEFQRRCEQLRKKNEYLQQLVPSQKGQKGRPVRRRRPATTKPQPTVSSTAPHPTPLELTEIDPEFPVVEVQPEPAPAPAVSQDTAQLHTLVQSLQQQLQQANQAKESLTQQLTIATMKPSSSSGPPIPSPGLLETRTPARQAQMYSDEDYAALQREMRDKMTTLTRERTKSDRITVQFEALAANEQRLIAEVERKTQELKEERQKALDSSRDAALAQMLQGQLGEIKKSYAAEQDLREDVEAENRKLTQRIFSMNSEGKGEVARIQDEIKQQKKVQACEKIYRLFSVEQAIKQMAGMRAFKLAQKTRELEKKELELEQQNSLTKKLEADLAMFKVDAGADDNQINEMSRILNADGNNPAAVAERDEARRELKSVLQENARLSQLLETNKLLMEEWQKERKDLEGQKSKLQQDLKELRSRRAKTEEGANDKFHDKIQALAKENARLLEELAIAKTNPGALPTGATRPQTPGGEEGLENAEDLSQYEGGEGVLQVSIMHATLSQLAIEDLGYSPSLLQSFVLADFASHQPTTTNLATGLNPNFNLEIEYAVVVDAFFLTLLLEEPVVFELYIRGGGLLSTDEAVSTPLATGTLSLADLLRNPDQRVLQRVDLLTVPTAGSMARCIGSVQLAAGMADSIAVVANRFMKNRSNALNATLHHSLTSTTAATSADPRATLAVHIISCSGLRIQRAGPPSACVAYQFFNFPPTDTTVEVSTANPSFNHIRFYEVVKDNHIKNYLKTAQLDFTVFDDAGATANTIIGSALVKLEPLLRKDTLQGQFDVISATTDKQVGVINLEISWQQPGVPSYQ